MLSHERFPDDRLEEVSDGRVPRLVRMDAVGADQSWTVEEPLLGQRVHEQGPGRDGGRHDRIASGEQLIRWEVVVPCGTDDDELCGWRLRADGVEDGDRLAPNVGCGDELVVATGEHHDDVGVRSRSTAHLIEESLVPGLTAVDVSGASCACSRRSASRPSAMSAGHPDSPLPPCRPPAL
jgi:hypothetical protein